MRTFKRFVLAIVVVSAFVGSYNFNVSTANFEFGKANAMQMEYRYVQNVLNRIEGNWYDNNGNLAIEVHDRYINGCEVAAGYDFVGGNPGGGKFAIREASGIRYMWIDWNTATYDGLNPYLKIDHGAALHR
jgi:hypothetical protein